MAEPSSVAAAKRPPRVARYGKQRGARISIASQTTATLGTRAIKRTTQRKTTLSTPALAQAGSPAWALYVDDARAAVDARSRFVEFLQSAGCDDDFINKAELIFGELLGNVVRHAPGPVEISVDAGDDEMILHVIDSGPPLVPVTRRLPEDVLSERGRGLFIVEQLATAVHIERESSRGNHLSVTMARRAV